MNGLLVLAAAAAAQAALPAATPTVKWAVDYDENYCIASRGYAVGGEELVLALQPNPTANYLRVFVQAPRPVETYDDEPSRIYVGSERLDTSQMLVVPVVKPGHARFSFGLEAAEYEKLRRLQRLAIDSKRVRASFDLPELPQVEKVLEDCIAGLLELWGLPKQMQAQLATFPRVKSQIFRAADYPRQAVIHNQIGHVEAVVMIDPAGRVSGCRLLRSSGHKDLDEKTCKVIRGRGKFEPALDRAGRPMASPYYLSVYWRTK